MNIHFTIAKKKDFDFVYQMMLRAKERSYSEGIFQWDERYPSAEMLLSDIEGGHLHLIKYDNNIVGFFVYNSSSEDDLHNDIPWMNHSNAWIFLHRLCVDPKHQRKGLGQITVRKLLEIATALGYKSIRVDVFSTNKAAIHIYDKLGFELLGECLCYRGIFYVFEKLL